MLSQRITRFVIVPQLAAMLLAGTPSHWTQPAAQKAGQATPECISAGGTETNPAVLSKPSQGGHGQERLASTPLDSPAAADGAAANRPSVIAGTSPCSGSAATRTPRISLCRWLI